MEKTETNSVNVLAGPCTFRSSR